ncbi:MAG: hypothetical protein IPJ25_00560 [Rhodocyclaceae bacterium]|nr:hypothetical protein [Rhodocyclaceae bacterium]
MTDFHHIKSVHDSPDASLIVANEAMNARHVRLLLVVNAMSNYSASSLLRYFGRATFTAVGAAWWRV